jgi:sterol desaturase/sphingolipid hydroxylase (fatty acid hydroxylase superfamily)
MLSTIIKSTKLILGTFSASTLSAYGICKYYNVPFFNPTQNSYQFKYQLYEVGKSTSIVLFNSIIFISFFIDSFVKYESHTMYQNIQNILLYSTLVELFYYAYHITVHKKEYYKLIHSKHHENIVVYPFDTFYMHSVDSYFLIASLGLPLAIVRLNYFENIISIYTYITAAYLAHSEKFFTHHAAHHKIIFCNYCIIIPIFDLIFGTYRH